MLKRIPGIAKYFLVGLLGPASLGIAMGQDSPAHVSDGATAGEMLYVTRGCYQCHGLAGQGSILSGPTLVPLRLTSEAFARLVRNPARAMPPYPRDGLSDLELAAIEGYIRTLPQPRALGEIPLLARYAKPDAAHAGARALPPGRVATASVEAETDLAMEEGGKIYASQCAMCHGVDRTGGIGPRLLDENLKRDLSATIALLKAPPAGMPALFPEPLSAEDIEAVAAYIRTPPHMGR